MRQATSVAYFEWCHNDRDWPMKDHYFIRITLLHDRKVLGNISYVYEFICQRFHMPIKSNAFEKMRVCKILWMILHNDTRIKSYTYEKFTRMKNYTYEKLHVWKVTRIEYWALIGALLYAYRLFHESIDTC